jgi:hypothetical protein
MKIWLAHLSGQQRSSQISSKEAERIEARLLIAPVTRTRAGYSDSLLPFISDCYSAAISSILLRGNKTSRSNDA